MTTPGFLQRLELLVGTKVIERLGETRVALFGLGGVGSWCAEALIRNGTGSLTMVDSDFVCTTNINRQLQATHSQVGGSKVDILASRLADINPRAQISAVREPYGPSNRDTFKLANYHYVIDAIDSLNNKVDLIQTALQSGPVLYSALGASCKLDPMRIQAGNFWEVVGCPLGKHLRKRLRNRGVNSNFTCVFSDENMEQFSIDLPCGTEECLCPRIKGREQEHDWCDQKKKINGSSVHVTGTFGFILAGLVLQDVRDKTEHLNTK